METRQRQEQRRQHISGENRETVMVGFEGSVYRDADSIHVLKAWSTRGLSMHIDLAVDVQ